jgi:arsenate reductase
MAEGFLKAMGGGRFEVFSAGVDATLVHPQAKRVMAESGIDISGQESNSVAEFAGQEFDFTITLCGQGSKKVCPVFPGKVGNRLHWDFVDPAEAEGDEDQRLEIFRQVRDRIRERIEQFLKSQGS